MFHWLLPSSPADYTVPEDKQANAFLKYKTRILVSTILAYAAYYVVKSNFTPSSPSLIKYEGFTTADIGLVLSVLAISYGIGKFFVGLLVDRLNPRFSVGVGLILSAIFNLLFGYTHNLALICVLMAFVGVTQGFGGPSCQKSLATWFNAENLGTATSTWNISHNIGSGTASLIVSTIIATYGASHIHNIFMIPSVISIIMAIIVMMMGVDTPESVGLPKVNKDEKKNIKHSSSWAAFRDNILRNPLVWAFCIMNAFSYILRYGIENWIPIYLSSGKGFSSSTTNLGFTIFEYAAIPGTILIGLYSDKVLKGRRVPITIATSLIVLILTPIYAMSQNLTLIYVILGILGISIYAQQVLMGIVIMDVLPIESVAGGIGLSGFFGYAFGEVAASYGIGKIVGSNNWNGAFWLVAISATICIIFFLYIEFKYKHKI
ncbi:MAG: MFS transporter [Limosilactobacillus sp.]|uniref:MFS transporter n=1 Tax=Limosilactobacillus sp. TaxID=2773925 RepID=UPI00270C4228|nr:MFS transporter [Limosilactobacillus sp.]